MAKLRISASEDEGTLQRTIFEFSRRNIEIERLVYHRDANRDAKQIKLGSTADALRVLKHLRRIPGVIDVESMVREEPISASVPLPVTVQELLG